MARTSKTVVVDGLPEMMAKVQPEALAAPLKELLSDASDVALAAAKEKVTGGTLRAVSSMVQSTSSGTASVRTMMSSTETKAIDKGRSPGAVVRKDIIALERWAAAVHYGDPRALAVRIYHSGTSGKKFLEGTKTELEDELPGLLDQLRAKIASWWERS